MKRHEAHAEPAGNTKELSYWKEEAQKHNKEAEHWKAVCKQDKASSEYINLLRDTTTQNLKLKSKVEELQDFKDCA